MSHCWSVAEPSLELRFAASAIVLCPYGLSGLPPCVTGPSRHASRPDPLAHRPCCSLPALPLRPHTPLPWRLFHLHPHWECAGVNPGHITGKVNSGSEALLCQEQRRGTGPQASSQEAGERSCPHRDPQLRAPQFCCHASTAASSLKLWQDAGRCQAASPEVAGSLESRRSWGLTAELRLKRGPRVSGGSKGRAVAQGFIGPSRKSFKL